jgi:endonuclease-3 related protein
MYERLRARWGHQGWWPGESALEVCVGAVLVQNTAWANVERALANLRKAKVLHDFARLNALSEDALAGLVRPAGTYNVKARRLRAFLDFVDRELGGDVARMSGLEVGDLRCRLLAVPGIGPETADSIVLYAAGRPVFVVDAYTRRILMRVGRLRGGETYDEVQRLLTRRLPRDAALFNDFHAQLVRLAKEHCRVRPLCTDCPLADRCPACNMAASARQGEDQG